MIKTFRQGQTPIGIGDFDATSVPNVDKGLVRQAAALKIDE